MPRERRHLLTHVVNLAHRVSRLHASYLKLHRAVFGFSWRRLLSARGWGGYGRCADELLRLGGELTEVRTTIAGVDSLEPDTTLAEEFVEALDRYTMALTETVERLHGICRRLQAEGAGEQAYDELAARRDRVAYDDSVQTYKSLGERLNRMFGRL
jgi:hypothetical protein